jgi:hypothetical protein
MSLQDLLDTLEDLMENCASKEDVGTEVFTVLITYMFLREGSTKIDFRRSSVNELIPRWFHHLRGKFSKLTTPISALERPGSIELNKLVYYFLCCSWTGISFLYPALMDSTADSFSQAVVDAIQYLQRDLGGECYHRVALLYSLYSDFFQEEVLVNDFSQLLSSPEVR